MVVLHARALVHIDNAHPQLITEDVSLELALSEDRAANSILGRINQLNRLFVGVHLLESNEGPEELLLLRAHAVVGVGDDGRLEEASLPLLISVGVTAQDHESAHVDAVLTDLQELLNVVQYGHGPDVRGLEHGVTQLEFLERLFGELVDEVLTDVLVHVDTLD